MKMRTFLCTICLLVFSICKSQEHRYIYYLDVNLNSVPKTKATILGKGVKQNDGFRLECYSITEDRLYMALHFTDSSLAELHGLYSSYHLNGKLEKQGSYVNGLEEGIWQSWDDMGRKVDSSVYKKGTAFINATFDYYKPNILKFLYPDKKADSSGNILRSYTLKDSLNDILQTVKYNDKGILTSEVFFKGEKGIIKNYTDSGIQTDSVFTKVEIEAAFPGGDRGWREYLMKTMDPTVPVNNKAPAGNYTVIVRFLVNVDGSIQNVEAETNHGYGMEKEVMNIIKKGPKWIPAVQYGRKVNAYRRQPVTFVIQE